MLDEPTKTKDVTVTVSRVPFLHLFYRRSVWLPNFNNPSKLLKLSTCMSHSQLILLQLQLGMFKASI